MEWGCYGEGSSGGAWHRVDRVFAAKVGGLSVFGKGFVTLRSAVGEEIGSVKAAVRLSCGAPRCPRLWRGSGCRQVGVLPCLKLWAEGTAGSAVCLCSPTRNLKAQFGR